MAGESNTIRIGTPGTQTDTYLAGIIHGDGSGLTGIAATIAPGSINSTQLASGLTLGGTVSFAGGIALPATTGAGTGVLQVNGERFLHAFGTDNLFVGANAGNFTLAGSRNTGLGQGALFFNTSGANNTAGGYLALQRNTTGSFNTAFGFQALTANTVANYNTAHGYNALSSNTTGSANTANGFKALVVNTTGGGNTAIGYDALHWNTSDGNTATGNSSPLRKHYGLL